MTSLHNLLDYIVDVLISDIPFHDKCVNLLGKELMYIIDADEEVNGGDFPLLMLHKLPKIEEKTATDEWTIQLILGVMIGEKIFEDGRWYRPKIESAEILMQDIVELFDKNLSTFGINGCTLRRTHTNTIVARIGDADDVQVISTIRLEEEQYL